MFHVPDIENAQLPNAKNACGIYACAVLIKERFSYTEQWFIQHFNKKECVKLSEIEECLHKHGCSLESVAGFSNLQLKKCVKKTERLSDLYLFITPSHASVAMNGMLNERNFNGWIHSTQYNKKKRVDLAFRINTRSKKDACSAMQVNNQHTRKVQ